MQACAPRSVSIILGILAIACFAMPRAGAAPAAPKSAAAKPHGPRAALPRAHQSLTARAHGSKSSATQEAARFGAAVGHDCNGRAAMQRDEGQWVVMCSNGKTYVVAAPPAPGAPATQCSLAGIGPEPPCFK
jgi:hypothetical protein